MTARQYYMNVSSDSKANITITHYDYEDEPDDDSMDALRYASMMAWSGIADQNAYIKTKQSWWRGFCDELAEFGGMVCYFLDDVIYDIGHFFHKINKFFLYKIGAACKIIKSIFKTKKQEEVKMGTSKKFSFERKYDCGRCEHRTPMFIDGEFKCGNESLREDHYIMLGKRMIYCNTFKEKYTYANIIEVGQAIIKIAESFGDELYSVSESVCPACIDHREHGKSCVRWATADCGEECFYGDVCMDILRGRKKSYTGNEVARMIQGELNKLALCPNCGAVHELDKRHGRWKNGGNWFIECDRYEKTLISGSMCGYYSEDGRAWIKHWKEIPKFKPFVVTIEIDSEDDLRSLYMRLAPSDTWNEWRAFDVLGRPKVKGTGFRFEDLVKTLKTKGKEMGLAK